MQQKVGLGKFIGYNSLTRNDAPLVVAIQRAQSQLLYGSPNEMTQMVASDLVPMTSYGFPGRIYSMFLMGRVGTLLFNKPINDKKTQSFSSSELLLSKYTLLKLPSFYKYEK